jgi:hypothetical protein
MNLYEFSVLLLENKHKHRNLRSLCLDQTTLENDELMRLQKALKLLSNIRLSKSFFNTFCNSMLKSAPSRPKLEGAQDQYAMHIMECKFSTRFRSSTLGEYLRQNEVTIKDYQGRTQITGSAAF